MEKIYVVGILTQQVSASVAVGGIALDRIDQLACCTKVYSKFR